MQSLAFNHNCSRTVGRGWNCSYRSPTYIVRLFEVGFRTRFNSRASRILFDNLSGLVPTVVMSPGFGPMNLSNYTREPNKTTMMIWPMETSGTIPDLCDLPCETRHLFVKHVPNIWKDGHIPQDYLSPGHTPKLILVYCCLLPALGFPHHKTRGHDTEIESLATKNPHGAVGSEIRLAANLPKTKSPYCWIGHKIHC